MERYGPRTKDVELLISQVVCLDAAQRRILNEIQEALWCDAQEDAWHAAIDAVEDAGRQGFWETAVRDARRVPWKASQNAAWYAAHQEVVVELARDLLSPDRVQLLTGQLGFVLDLPPWWSEPGCRNLFLEMLGEGCSVAEARASVAALVA